MWIVRRRRTVLGIHRVSLRDYSAAYCLFGISPAQSPRQLLCRKGRAQAPSRCSAKNENGTPYRCEGADKLIPSQVAILVLISDETVRAQ